MKKYFPIALLALFPMMVDAAQPWREITLPTVSEAAASFAKPPKEYSAIHWAIWGGQQDKERIIADIDRIAANGGGVYMINNSQRVQPAYLSPEYMDLVKAAVQECKKNGMKLWIEGDCGYPDGFAGGLISRDYPQLGMQGIVTDARCVVAAGQTLDIPMPIDTLGIVAYSRAEAAPTSAPAGTTMPLPADGKFNYRVPRGGGNEIIVQLPSVDIHYSITAGEPFAIPVPTGTKAILLGEGGARGGRGARGGAAGATPGTIIPMSADGNLKWTAPPGSGSWEITFIRHAYRTSPTRNDNGEDGGATKDSLYTLIDYLDPAATDTYLKVIYGAYEKAVGDEFGKTVMGFRADETDYTNVNPWTPKLLDVFQSQKGYDLKPYIAQIFGSRELTPEAQRAKADYFDVWSAMFRDNFYKRMEDWCTSRNMEFMIHLNHEEVMLSNGEGMIKNEGSFWRDMRYVGVPGIDNLNQIRPGLVADFPKLAASAAHLFGRSLVWEEEGGGPGQAGKFVADYQLVRGVNYLNMRGLNLAPADARSLEDPGAAIGWYISRAEHLLAIGRPAAQVALFHPTDSMWMNDRESDDVTVKLVTELMEHQVDFDHIDSDTLATVCTLEGGGLKNLSGQIYRAVVIPTSTVIQKNVLDRLRAFAAAGGKVIFVGRTPSMVADRSFLHADATPDLGFATIEPSPEITDRVIAALPKPDVKLDSPCAPLKYIHRTLKDGDVYFFFNEAAETQTRTATVDGRGQVQVWDATTGTIHPLAGVGQADGSVAIPLTLASHEGRFIVIGPVPAGAATPFPTVSTAQTLATLEGDWSVTFGEKQSDAPLKSWQDLGAESFNGIAEYRKTFSLPASMAPGRRVYLDLGNLMDAVRVSVNGSALDSRGWAPYLWDVTDAIKSGANTVEVQVQAVTVGGRGGGGGGFGGGAGRAGRGARAGAGGRGAARRRPFRPVRMACSGP